VLTSPDSTSAHSYPMPSMPVMIIHRELDADCRIVERLILLSDMGSHPSLDGSRSVLLV
jgi:hypothetical protein